MKRPKMALNGKKYEWWKSKTKHLSAFRALSLTRHWLGGGGAHNAPPLANFLKNLKKREDIDAKLTVRYSTSIWHPQTKFQQNPSRTFWENGVLVMSCLAILGQKRPHSFAPEMQDFKVKRNQQTPKDAKLHVLQNGYLRFRIFFWFFTPKYQNFYFFQNECLKKSKNLWISLKLECI